MTNINTATANGSADQLLRGVLQGNMFFSGLSGLLLAGAAAPLARWLGVPAIWPLLLIGVGLLGFAWLLSQIARTHPLNLRQANGIFWLDVAWVVGSALLLVTGWVPLTTAGWWAVLLVADMVAIFAILEFVGIRRVRTGRA